MPCFCLFSLSFLAFHSNSTCGIIRGYPTEQKKSTDFILRDGHKNTPARPEARRTGADDILFRSTAPDIGKWRNTVRKQRQPAVQTDAVVLRILLSGDYLRLRRLMAIPNRPSKPKDIKTMLVGSGIAGGVVVV